MNNKKRLLVLGMLFVLAVFLVGCGGSPVSSLPKYTLHIKVTPDGAGEVKVTDGSNFSKNTEVILTPNANSGWTFDHWAGFNANQVIADGNVWKIVMDSDKTLTAVFKQAPTNQSPTVSLAADPLSGKAPLTVNFTATGQDPDNDPLKYDWTFGDGGTQLDGGAQLTHTYQTPGNYVAKVTVKDDKGGTATAEVTIEVAVGNHNPTAVNDTATLDEDTEINIDILANDTDSDGDSLTIDSVSEATQGTVAVQNGLLHYTPKANFNGSDSFTYTVLDGKGGQATATVTVTVNPVNDLPVAVNDTVQLDQDGSVLIDVLHNDTDVDGDTLSIASFGLANSGTITKEGNSLRYTPGAGYYGEDQFNYVISDGNGGSAQATVMVTINRVNHLPVAVNDTAEVDEDSNVSIPVLTNDTDADDDTLTIQTFTQGGHGQVAKEGNNLRYTPAANYNGSDNFTYTISDGHGGTASATVNVTVKPVNDAPIAQNDVAQVDEDDSVLINVLANDNDIDENALTVQTFTQGTHGAVAKEGNNLRYTPAANYVGSDSFTYEVSDGNGGTATATVTVTVKNVNDAPVAVNDTDQLDEDNSILLQVLANDSDVDGDTLVIQSFTSGTHGNVAKEGNALRYTPVANFNGSDTFSYVVSDGKGGTAQGTVTLTINAVNDAPVAQNDLVQIVEGADKLVNVLQNDSDVDGDTLSVISFTQGAAGTVTQEGNSLRYVPNTNFNGQDQFSYTISDGKGGTATATVTITVDEVNDPPVANPDVPPAVSEDGTILINVLDNDSDIESDPLTITNFTQGSHGKVALEGNALRYTPDTNYNGPDSFTYTISDGNGGTATTTVTISVLPVNDAPVAVNDPAQLDEDGAVVIDVLTNDTDVDGDILAIQDFSQGTHGTVVKVGNSLRYTPTANYNGSDSFTYQINDGNGGSATATVNVTVKPVNDAPVANTDTPTVNEDANVLIDVLGNDSDVDGDTLTIASYTQGSHGTVAQEGVSLRYTPVANYYGADSFTYTINDGKGGETTATVNVTVNAVNDAPVAVNDATPVNEDDTVLIDVVANDTDVEGDSLTVSGFTQGTHGTVAKEGNSLRYTPTANYNGSDSFTYQINDGNAGTATATVNVTVNPVNDAPVVSNETVSVNEDANILINVLQNDSDVEGDTLTITAMTQGSHGTVAQEGNSLRYTPAANYNGADTFTYDVNDGKGGVTTGTVNVTVTPVNDAPIAIADAPTVNEDATVLVDVVANDTDVDGDALTVASFTQGAHGTVAQEGNSLRYAPVANYYGSDSFTYQISDGNGGTASTTVNVTVNSVNDAPVANTDSTTVAEDANVLVNVLLNDTDIEGDALTVSSFGQGTHGTVAKEGNDLRYTPAADYNGADSFTYDVNDGNGGVTTGTVNVTVTPVNDAPVAVNDAIDVDQNSQVLIDVTANDTDVDQDTLTVASFTQGIHGTVVQVGNNLRYTPDVNYFGADSFTYQINDGHGQTSTATVNVTVKLINVAPIANNDAETVNEDSNILINVLLNDTDADGDSLTINSFGQGSHGTVTQEGSSLRYTPAANYHGADSFTYQISDGKGGVASATVSVTVTSVNDISVANDDVVTLDEDVITLIDVVANDTDADGDTLTVTSFTQGAHGTVVQVGNSLRYTPVANYYGADSFTYTISDGNGSNVSATVNLTVNSVNDAPVTTADNASVNEDANVLINVLLNDSDVEGDILTVTSFTQGSHGTVAKEGNSLRYTPTANYYGADSFTYQVSDGNGGVTTETVNITVDSVNDAPVTTVDTASLDEDANVLINVLLNDIDVEGDTLTITSFTQGTHGTVAKEGNSLRYTPTANYYGADSFTYTISDGNGATVTETVNVTVNSVNDAPVTTVDNVSVNEDANVLVDVLLNDSDVEGDALTITSFTQGTHGTVAKEGNSLRYTPTANYYGADSFTYTISDGNGGVTTETVNVTVDSVNDVPVAADDAATLNEDGTTLIDVVANDTDVEGDTLTVTSFTQGANGTVAKEGNSLRYTPAANYFGADSFTYTISDGNGGSVTATVNLTINSVNDVPVTTVDTTTVNEDANVLINVLLNDMDVEGDILTITSFTQGSHGTVAQEGNSLRYTPTANYFGADSFTYTISDSNGGVTTETVNVTVDSVNDAPVTTVDTASLDEDANVLINVLLNDSDVEGDTLTITSFTQGSHGTVAQEGNSLRYTPTANYYGTDSFTYTISDGNGGTVTETVNVTVNSVNDAPATTVDNVSVNEDANILINVLGNDSDVEGDTLTITSFTQGTHGTVAKEGNSLRYTPVANYYGADTFTYTINDGNGGVTTETVNVTVDSVNDVPVAADDAATLNEDGTTLIDVVANDTDVEGDTLTVSSFTQGANGTVVQVGNSLRYTPTANYYGVDSFTYTISDGNGGSVSATVNLTINSVNDAPATTVDTASLDEDANVLINVLVNDSDVEGDTLTITGFTQGTHGTVTQEGNSFRYTPVANYHGTDSFTYTVSDGNGGVTTETVNVTVVSVNDVPVAVNDSATFNEDGTTLIDVVANDTDLEGDSLTVSSFTQGANGTVTLEGNSLRYTPVANFNGSDSFTYTISDGNGGTATATVNLTVNAINDAPTLINDSASLNEDANVLINILGNDSDVEGDTLTITSFTQGTHGTVALEGNSLRYTPEANYHGADSFIYEVSDGNGGVTSATVTITVISVNDTPVATVDASTTNEDTPVTIDVVANDTDVDGDYLTVNSFTQGTHGTVAKIGNSLRYTPAANYYGSDSFTYQISDGRGGTATATVNMTINSVNDAPIANADSATVNQDETILIDVVANDTDVDGDALSISSVTQGSHGMVSKEGNSIRYTPDAGYSGSDSFTYTISDGRGGLATTVVDVTVATSGPLLAMDIAQVNYSTGNIVFTVTKAGIYKIETSYLQQVCDTFLYLYDVSLTELATDDESKAPYACIVQYLDPGTYYVRVDEYSGAGPLYCHLEIALQ